MRIMVVIDYYQELIQKSVWLKDRRKQRETFKEMMSWKVSLKRKCGVHQNSEMEKEKIV